MQDADLPRFHASPAWRSLSARLAWTSRDSGKSLQSVQSRWAFRCLTTYVLSVSLQFELWETAGDLHSASAIGSNPARWDQSSAYQSDQRCTSLLAAADAQKDRVDAFLLKI